MGGGSGHPLCHKAQLRRLPVFLCHVATTCRLSKNRSALLSMIWFVPGAGGGLFLSGEFSIFSSCSENDENVHLVFGAVESFRIHRFNFR